MLKYDVQNLRLDKITIFYDTRLLADNVLS